jgi:mannose-6-phosphate isomerase-like protein (cupin superfamily)
MADETVSTGRFDIGAIAGSFPETAATLLVDEYLTNREQASSRVFRVYRPTPAHYHATCDEYLYVFSGRGTFWMKDPATEAGKRASNNSADADSNSARLGSPAARRSS